MPDNYKYINMEYLEGMASGMNELIIEMIEIYKEQSIDFIPNMRKAMDNKDYTELNRITHDIKATSKIMGMNAVGERLQILEINAKNQENIGTFNAEIDYLESILPIAIAELDNEIAKKK